MCLSSLTSAKRLFFFFFNDTATTEIYTLSLHDALPISDTAERADGCGRQLAFRFTARGSAAGRLLQLTRSEEHTSELQSRSDLVCRLLLEKKKLCSDGDMQEGVASEACALAGHWGLDNL